MLVALAHAIVLAEKEKGTISVFFFHGQRFDFDWLARLKEVE